MVNLERYRLPKLGNAPGDDRVARKYFLSQDAVDTLEAVSQYLNRNLSDTMEILIREAGEALPRPEDGQPVPDFNPDVEYN